MGSKPRRTAATSVTTIVEQVLGDAAYEDFGGRSPDDYRAAAMLHIALAQPPPARSRTLRRAAELADDPRILTAVAGQMHAPPRACLDKAVTAIRVNADPPGSAILLVQLAGFFAGAKRDAVLLEGAEAGRDRPAALGDVARGNVASFWPHVGRRIGTDDASRLWERVSTWRATDRLHVRARLAACLPEAAVRDAEHQVIIELAAADADNRIHEDFRQLAVMLSSSSVDEALDLTRHLGPFSTPSLVTRCLELDRTDDALALLATIKGTPWYWATVADSLARVDSPELAGDLKAHIDTLPATKVAFFFEDHARALARSVPEADLYALTEAMTPRDRVRSLCALVPFTSSRDAWLDEARAIALQLPTWASSSHALIPCARWLDDADALALFERLLRGHELFGSALVGADGSPDEFPGIWQLVSLIERLGGERLLAQIVSVIDEALEAPGQRRGSSPGA